MTAPRRRTPPAPAAVEPERANIFDAFDEDALAEGCGTGPEIINADNWLCTEPPPHRPILLDTFDRGDKVAVIGGPKMRKSFFLLQCAVSLTTGRAFLCWGVPRPFRVLYVQPEIQEHHMHRRLKRMCDALEIRNLESNLHIVNSRGFDGLDVTYYTSYARRVNAEVVLFDPLYKFATGDENSAMDMKPVLRNFDMLAKETGACVMYAHHDSKGDASRKSISDRGAGSGVLARDYDACITLTAHKHNPETAVINTLLRNYAPQDAFCATWENGCFRLDDQAATVTGTPTENETAFCEYVREHPQAIDAEIARAIGCDRSTAGRIRQRLRITTATTARQNGIR